MSLQMFFSFNIIHRRSKNDTYDYLNQSHVTPKKHSKTKSKNNQFNCVQRTTPKSPSYINLRPKNVTWLPFNKRYLTLVQKTTPRTINISEQLALDIIIFNGLVITSDHHTHGDGTYRVYAAFRDPDGDVLVCDDESLLEAWYEFGVDTS